MGAVAQPLTQQASQEFDPVSELRKRYPGIAREPDDKVIQHLSNPANFRAAFPEYEHLDDETITRNMARHAPNLPGGTPQLVQAVKEGKAPGAPTHPTEFEQARSPENQTGFWGTVWNKLKDAVTPDKPGAPMTDASLSESLGRPVTIAGSKANDLRDYSMGGNAGLFLGREMARQADRPLPPGTVAKPLYRAATIASPLVPGLDPEAMERAADVGNKKAVLAEAAAPTAIATAPLAAEGVGAAVKPLARPLMKAAKATGEIATQAKRGLTEPLGIGVPGERMVKQGISPYAKQLGFDKALETAGNDIVAYHKQTPIKTVQDLHDALPEIRSRIMQEEIQPIAEAHAKETLTPEAWARIDKDVADAVHPFQRKIEGGGVPAAAQDVLDKIHKAETIGDMIGVGAGDRGGALGWLNSQLESYFKKYPSARKGDLMKNPDTAALEGARRALRREALDHLEAQGEEGIRGARQRWGAADELSRATERRINQADRLKPIGIGKAFGLAMAPKTAGLSYILGAIGDWLNKPDTLVGRGIEKMAAKPITVKASGAPELAEKPPARPLTVFRAHDVGKYDVDLKAHAHATESEAEAQSYAEHRNQGTPQKVSKIHIGDWKPEDFEEMKGPRGNKWFKFKRQPKPEEYE